MALKKTVVRDTHTHIDTHTLYDTNSKVLPEPSKNIRRIN